MIGDAAVIGYELYCGSCQSTWRAKEDETYKLGRVCPFCYKEDVVCSPFVTCSCGTTVYLDTDENECETCGTVYSDLGIVLREPEV